MLLANAGIDHSNTPKGTVVLLPEDPMASAHRIRKEIKERTGSRIGVIIADSRTQPLRLGVVGVAVGVAGFVPIQDMRGQPDLYGRPLRITRRALADDLASAAELLMSEADERIPVVRIRNAPLEVSEKKWTSQDLAISAEECLYMKIFNDWRRDTENSSN
jgi:coenzyme F420-0:L-glutamate ligase